MKFVGIRNCREKALLQQCVTSEIREYPPNNLLLDGQRHLEFLRLVDMGMDFVDYSSTLYWKYLIFFGMSEKVALEKMRQFAEFYREIKKHGFDKQKAYGAVADNGVRLDGSHRAAIACSLGMTSLPVHYYRWEDRFSARCLEEIYAEARVKIAGYHTYFGKTAFTRESGTQLGRVEIIDARPVKNRIVRFFRKISDFETYAIIDRGELGLVAMRIRNIELQP